ncbi:integrase [Streptomyces sp. NPDC059373]
MRVTMTSAAARTGHANEDFTGAVPTAAVLIDGAGISGTESICRHGVAWYASRLGGSLLRLLSLVRDRSLAALLAEAIEQVTDDHRGTCDVADPISPSATVAILRLSDGLVEHLVLGDSVLVLDRADGAPLVVSDPREVIISRSYGSALEAAAEGGDEFHRVLRALRANRNQPGGFWVAKDDPRAADEAITGSCPISELTGAVLLSNGASRIVDRFRLADWPGVMASPGVERTRRNHSSCPAGRGAPRGAGGRCDDRTLYRPGRGMTVASGACPAAWRGMTHCRRPPGAAVDRPGSLWNVATDGARPVETTNAPITKAAKMATQAPATPRKRRKTSTKPSERRGGVPRAGSAQARPGSCVVS